MIHFVGAGCGAADLITVRGKALLEQADVIVYAGSLVNPALLEYKKEGCRVYDSARMTLEEVLAVMQEAEAAGLDTVRLHTGDPCLYGAIREQMDELDKRGVDYDYCPGVSIFTFLIYSFFFLLSSSFWSFSSSSSSSSSPIFSSLNFQRVLISLFNNAVKVLEIRVHGTKYKSAG